MDQMNRIQVGYLRAPQKEAFGLHRVEVVVEAFRDSPETTLHTARRGAGRPGSS